MMRDISQVRHHGFVDLNRIAKTDECGYPHKYPFRRTERVAPDMCGNYVKGLDVHLVGNAYTQIVHEACTQRS